VFTLDAARQSANSLYLRLFDAAGVQLVADGFSGPNSSPRVANFRLPATGTYYVGVSGWSNTTYNPNTANSGANGATGNYALTLQRVGAGSTSLAGVTAAATSGTPRIASIPSALVGQTITLSGSGLLTGERIVFTTSDDGPFGTVVATAATVAGDGTSLTVVVPTNATTGMVRLERENVGRLLQIVPTLVDVDNGARFETYTIAGERGSGQMKVNGAAARLVHRGDTIIVISYAQYSRDELLTYEPVVVHVEAGSNAIVDVDAEVATLLTGAR